ncbi:MAG: AAA family ATPase [Alphaproteobacteria bacterium]|nr:AAA family ATPase [Alphaproteobacteria bacterium]
MDDAQELLGRGQDIAQLRADLDQYSILLIGPRRIGKTELLKRLVSHPGRGWRAVRVDLEGLDAIDGAVNRIAAKLAEAGLGPNAVGDALERIREVSVGPVGLSREGREDPGPWARLEQAIAVALHALPNDERLALLLDEVPWWLDSLRQAGDDAQARQALAQLRYLRDPKGQTPRLRMVLTGSVALAGLARSLNASAEINDLLPIELGPLDAAAGRTLFEEELLRRGIHCTAEAAKAAHKMAGGSPHWIKLLAQRIQGTTRAEASDVNDAVQRLMSPRLRHLFDDEGRAHLLRRHGPERGARLRWMLTAAAGHDDGVPAQALLAVALSEAGLVRAEAQEDLYTLVDEFYLEEVDGRYRFVNPLLRRWWLKYGSLP